MVITMQICVSYSAAKAKDIVVKVGESVSVYISHPVP